MQTFEALTAEDPVRVGSYTLVGRLGAGGMGRVYLGRSRGGRAVAVKVVRPELAEDETFRRRFAREVAAARRVNGAFTATVVDADPEGAPAWLATAYVPGLSLADAVTAHGAWPVGPVRTLGAGLAEALEAIHAAGVVHRDLKPSNVLLAADGPRVIDFGISVAAEASALTRTGLVMGTPGFMSPELLTREAVGPAGDVFSLGAVLAFAARGVGPFGTGPAPALNFRVVHGEPELTALDPELRAVVERCLAKDPARRPTVSELLDLLAEAAAPTGSEWLPEPVVGSVLSRSGRAEAEVAGVREEGAVVQAEEGSAPAEAEGASAVTRPPAVPHQGPGPQRWPGGEQGGAPGPRPETSAVGPGPGTSAVGPGPETSALGPGPGTSALGPSRRSTLIRLGLLAAAGGAGFGVWRALRKPANSGATWRVSLDAFYLSQPVVAAGILYFGTSYGTVHALETATGAREWAAPGVFGRPDYRVAVTGGAVYTIGGDGLLHAIDAADGRRRWATDISPSLVSSTAPTAVGSTVFAATYEGLVAVDAATGELRWTARTGSGSGSPLAVGGVVYTPGWAQFDGGGHRLYAVDAVTGDILWDFPAQGEASFTTPAVLEGLVCVGDSSRRLHALDAATGRARWTIARSNDSGVVPAMLEGSVFYGEGTKLVALDAATGDRRWSYTVGAGPVRGTVAAADGLVYVSGSQELHVVDAATGERRAMFSVPDYGTGTPPAVSDGLVFCCFSQELYAFPVPVAAQRA